MVYIQKNNDGIPHHFDCACAMYGAMELGLDYKLVTFEEVQSGKWDNLIRTHLFVGSVEFMTEVFSRVGIEQPRLPMNNLREFKEMKLKDFIYTEPVFIKPKSIKAFTGFVVDEVSKSMIGGLDGELDIIVQEVLPSIKSEWRCYVFNGKIVDVRHYSGDIYGDTEYIVRTYNRNQIYLLVGDGMPETFVIDIAFRGGGKGVTVIEFNDMWAIGNYGVPNDLYVRMLKQRYFDIIKNGK